MYPYQYVHVRICSKMDSIMEEEEIHPVTNYDLKLRIYQPENEDLQKYVCHIDPYPKESIDEIKQIIQNSIDQSPDKPNTKINFSSTKLDADLKRMMQSQIDQLKSDTLESLKQMRK